MKVATIQPHRLIEELQRATVPVEETPLQEAPPPAPAKVGLVARLKDAFSRQPAVPQTKKLATRGVPHGVEKVLVHARNIQVCGNAVAYCHSHSYEVVGPLPKGDDQEYPTAVTTEVAGKLPRNGNYDVLMAVSVNGTVAACIQEFQPAAVA